MKLFKILLTVVILSMSNLIVMSQSSSGSGNNSGGNSTISIPIKPIGGNHKGPQDPTQSPITCILMGDCLSLICNYDAMAEVTVTNNQTMETVAADSANLGEGLILTLDHYTLGVMSITITMSGITYIGNF